MTAIIGTPSGGNLTVSFSYTGPTAKVQDTVLDAAAWIASTFGTDISGYTNQQKANLVDDYIKNEIVAIARRYHTKAAAAIAETENLTKYGL